jgi:Lon protease-like protein
VKETVKPFVGIKEYSSAMEIAENIDREIAETKSALGEYLRQLDDKRGVAEKTKRLHDVVAKMANKKEAKESSNQIEVNGLEIVLDATALNELTAIESVVKSHQQRLMALQQAREALQTLDQAGDTEGIKYLALEREGIPEQILLKLS